MPLPNFSLMPTLVKEALSPRTLERTPEPVSMDGEEQVSSFLDAGTTDSMMAGSYVFHAEQICRALSGCRLVIDLGCGPAVQLCQVAALNPEMLFIGIDLSEEALIQAGERARAQGLENIDFQLGDISDLNTFSDCAVDGVMSTLALHHLQTVDDLDQCFREISRVLHHDGALFLADLLRPKLRNTAKVVASLDSDRMPQFYMKDYERSLLAAFLREDFEELLKKHFNGRPRFYSSFPPLTSIIKTESRQLSQPTLAKLTQLRQGLSPGSRRNYELLRLLFRLSGL